MEEAHNLTDRTFIILRKRNFLELTFQEFRGQYSTTFNVMKAPERAKLMKLAIIKVSYSAKHGKQIMKIFIERDFICDSGPDCCKSSELCHKLHCLKSSDRCYLFDRDQTCNNPKCRKLHIPNKSLHERINQVFKKSNRSSMPFSKFIVLHRTTYPYLREHHPTNDILSSQQFIDTVRIETTEKTKEIRLLRHSNNRIERPPSLSENIDAPYPALKIMLFDQKWCDTNNLIHDIINLFSCFTIKDIFIPGHSRMAFVTFNDCKNAQNAVKKLNNTWFCGRKVTVSLTLQNINDNENEEKVPLSSSRIIIKAINNVISEERIKEWLDRIGRINNIQTCFSECRKGSDVAYIHFKSLKIIHEILNKSFTFRGKQIKLKLVDDGYTDSTAYYSLKKLHKSKANHMNNKNDINEHKQSKQFIIKQYKKKEIFKQKKNVNHNQNDDKKQKDSMQLLVQRLKLLIENTIETEKDLQNKLAVISRINNNNKPNNDDNIDVDIAFGDETYTIAAMTQSLLTLKTDINQISVYKQALTAFETSQARSIHKNQKELKPICDKEIRLAKSLQSVKNEIELLEKQLLLKKNQASAIKSELEITRIGVKSLRKNITEMKHKIEPIRQCLTAFDNKSKNKKKNIGNKLNDLPTEKQIEMIESNLNLCSRNISHWLKWKQWNLSDATQWIANLANGKFKSDLNKFNALSNISKGSILNAITDPTLQIIGIDDENDRKIIIKQIALLKSRTAMMKKSIKSYENKHNVKPIEWNHRKSMSSTNFFKGARSLLRNKNSHSLDDISVGDMIRSVSQSSNKDNNLCVICMDREIAPYAMVPCGHQSLCSICKDLIKPNKHKCPMCNGKVTMIIKLFRA